MFYGAQLVFEGTALGLIVRGVISKGGFCLEGISVFCSAEFYEEVPLREKCPEIIVRYVCPETHAERL